MIAAVSGVLEDKTLDAALVNVHGVTLRVFAPLNTLVTLQPGEPVRLHTYLLVREDALALYGFATSDDLAMFEQLLAVSGVGPRIALALISALSSTGLYEAILQEDINRLSTVSGVGKKLAARLVLELRPRLEKLAPPASGTLTSVPQSMRAQVVEALTSLGYSSAQANMASRNLKDEPGVSIESLVLAALRNLSAE